METITHREMRNNSAEVLRRVAAGESFVVTNNGEEVAVLSPRGKPSSHLERLIADGVVTPAANRGVYRAEPQHYDGPPSGEVIAADRARR